MGYSVIPTVDGVLIASLRHCTNRSCTIRPDAVHEPDGAIERGCCEKCTDGGPEDCVVGVLVEPVGEVATISAGMIGEDDTEDGAYSGCESEECGLRLGRWHWESMCLAIAVDKPHSPSVLPVITF
jgi:hypothetical protein